jgi:CRP-like cAMP-binding protein
MERIIVEGTEGTSLFVVGEGQLEALVRQRDGVDKVIGLKQRGDVIGEISLLTGERRTATVRAVDGAVVYEIGKQQYEPIIKARPAIVNQLVVIMEAHLRDMHSQQDGAQLDKESTAIGQRIWRFFFGGNYPAAS